MRSVLPPRTVGISSTDLQLALHSNRDYEAKERDFGYVFKVSGPLVVADRMSGAAMYELVSLRPVSEWMHTPIVTYACNAF